MNTKPTHTPGPWTLDTKNYVCGQIRANLASTAPGEMYGYYSTIATVTQRDAHPVYGGGIPAQVMEANARLIAASPELLALARDFLRLMECSETRKHVDATRHGAFDYYAKNARAAIAKAEGRA